MDTVFIHGLTLDTVIGCYDYEKTQTQKVVLDIEMAWDIQKAARSDALQDTLDYDAVCKRITQLLEQETFELVEALAESLVDTIMTEFNVPGIRLKLAKPEAIITTSTVGVAIARGIRF